MREAVVGEVTKMMKNESHMYVIGYLESVLSYALEHMTKNQAERILQAYFYDRKLPVKVSDDTREWLNKYGN
jgi:hypothetical protein